jgi:hypothetical protein
MRLRVALTLAAVVGLTIYVAASADARPHPEAYGATLKYLATATSSCAGQSPVPGGMCTQANTFTVAMRVLGTQSYQVDVKNTDLISSYRYFAWLVPDGMTLSRIVSSRAGDCGISSGMITCARKVAAPGCGCSQPDLIVDFTATGRTPTRAKGGYWIHYGLVTAFLDVPSTFSDVPICDIGEKSTTAHPCLK